jgi:hypothetical protein
MPDRSTTQPEYHNFKRSVKLIDNRPVSGFSSRCEHTDRGGLDAVCYMDGSICMLSLLHNHSHGNVVHHTAADTKNLGNHSPSIQMQCVIFIEFNGRISKCREMFSLRNITSFNLLRSLPRPHLPYVMSVLVIISDQHCLRSHTFLFLSTSYINISLNIK